MKTKLVLAVFVTIMAMGCRMIPEPTPTPLPGWRSPVSALLVEDNAFPEGWVREREFPDTPEPTINHVYRQWWGEARGAGMAGQAIWRAYTVADAKKKYAELRNQRMFTAVVPLDPSDSRVGLKPPPEIDFRSQIADEFYLACGGLGIARCEMIARYRNYVTAIGFDLEAKSEGYVTHGLTYAEIEAVLRAMDAKFAEALETLPTPPP